MMKNKINFSLLKTMLKNSYDTDNIIDKNTKKLNKKSIRVWLIILVCTIIIYVSYMTINALKEIGISEFFLKIFFLLLQILVMFQTMLLVISVIYFSKDIENYLYLPISSMKLFINKFIVMMSIIFGSEILMALPSIFIYGVLTLQNIWFYIISLIVTILVSIFLSTVVSIIMIFIMRICRFIKSKFLYQNIVILIMTLIIFIPISNSFNINNVQPMENEIQNENINNEAKARQELETIALAVNNSNKYFIVTELGVNALTDIDYHSIIYVLELLGMDLLAILVFLVIGKFTYIKDILWNLSIFDRKKNKNIILEGKCKAKNKEYAYLRNEINSILKNPTYLMHYIYNVLIVLAMVILITISIFPVFLQALIDASGGEIFNDLTFDFSEFSLIIGIIEVMFIISSLSLTAISRYGKNAIFFKYIPIKFKTQFKLKNIPQIFINTIITISILGTIHYLIPGINNAYILSMLVVAMLLNIINSNILLFIDLLKPRLNYENEISVIKQNDNKLFQYILTTVICLFIWYLKEVTKELSLDLSILIEVIIFTLIVVGMEIFINKRGDKLFKNIN